MKIIIYSFILIVFIRCNEKEVKIFKPVHKASKFENLLAKFDSISFDTLKVFSSYEPEKAVYKYKGKPLERADIKLIPKILKEQFGNDTGYFACYKFSISTNGTGLIMRTPAMYQPTSVKLLLFDISLDSITDITELSETFGDAGDAAEKTSWIFQDNNKSFKSFMRYQQSHDNSVDDHNDTTVQKWDYYYLFDLSKSKIDTVSKDNKELIMQFQSLIIRQTKQKNGLQK